MLRAIILVGIGGGVGSIFRYLTAVLLGRYFQTLFPVALFTANVVGSFLIGLLLGLSERQQWSSPDLKFLFITGFCGGYTTFSTFSADNLFLCQSGHCLTAFLHIAASVLTGMAAVWLGWTLTKI